MMRVWMISTSTSCISRVRRLGRSCLMNDGYCVLAQELADDRASTSSDLTSSGLCYTHKLHVPYRCFVQQLRRRYKGASSRYVNASFFVLVCNHERRRSCHLVDSEMARSARTQSDLATYNIQVVDCEPKDFFASSTAPGSPNLVERAAYFRKYDQGAPRRADVVQTFKWSVGNVENFSRFWASHFVGMRAVCYRFLLVVRAVHDVGLRNERL